MANGLAISDPESRGGVIGSLTGCSRVEVVRPVKGDLVAECGWR